jgi:signal transduction histidine kinase
MLLLSLFENYGASNPYPDLKIASGRLGKSINDIHSLSHLLNGRQMKKIGLIEAIHKELKFVNSVYCMSCTFTYDPLPDMGSDKNLLLFRIVQEAVYNSLRHGCASELAIRIKYDEKGLLMKIKDNGRGFNPSGLGRNSGIGLSNIRERIKLLGGTMRLESSPDLGTTLFLTC